MPPKPDASCASPSFLTVCFIIKCRRPANVTSALADLKGISLSYNESRKNDDDKGGINSDVIALSQRFAMLMAEYNQSIEDGIITINEAKRLLKETLALQQVLIDMKLHLEEEAT